MMTMTMMMMMMMRRNGAPSESGWNSKEGHKMNNLGRHGRTGNEHHATDGLKRRQRTEDASKKWTTLYGTDNSKKARANNSLSRQGTAPSYGRDNTQDATANKGLLRHGIVWQGHCRTLPRTNAARHVGGATFEQRHWRVHKKDKR